MRRLPLLLVLAAAPAAAQPVSPNVPAPPVNLDPGVEAAPPPPVQAPAPVQQKPNVVIVGPDGKVTNVGGEPDKPTGEITLLAPCDAGRAC